MANFKTLVKESAEAAKVLNSKVSQVAGQGGILQRLNEAHINALNSLVNNPNDKSRINRVSGILKREERVLGICRDGLSEYESLLERLEAESSKFLKKNVLNDVSFLMNVIEKLKSRILRLLKRIDIERRMISQWDSSLKRTPEKIRQVIRILEREERDIGRVIRQCKPEKVGKLRTLYAGLNQSTFAKVINFTAEETEHLDQAFVMIPPLLATLITLPAELILKLLYGLSIDDRELQAEIRNLKHAT